MGDIRGVYITFVLYQKNDEKLNTQRLLSMARGVCSGMEYLSAVGYVHRVSYIILFA